MMRASPRSAKKVERTTVRTERKFYAQRPRSPRPPMVGASAETAPVSETRPGAGAPPNLVIGVTTAIRPTGRMAKTTPRLTARVVVQVGVVARADPPAGVVGARLLLAATIEALGLIDRGASAATRPRVAPTNLSPPVAMAGHRCR